MFFLICVTLSLSESALACLSPLLHVIVGQEILSSGYGREVLVCHPSPAFHHMAVASQPRSWACSSPETHPQFSYLLFTLPRGLQPLLWLRLPPIPWLLPDFNLWPRSFLGSRPEIPTASWASLFGCPTGNLIFICPKSDLAFYSFPPKPTSLWPVGWATGFCFIQWIKPGPGNPPHLPLSHASFQWIAKFCCFLLFLFCFFHACHCFLHLGQHHLCCLHDCKSLLTGVRPPPLWSMLHTAPKWAFYTIIPC